MGAGIRTLYKTNPELMEKIVTTFWTITFALLLIIGIVALVSFLIDRNKSPEVRRNLAEARETFHKARELYKSLPTSHTAQIYNEALEKYQEAVKLYEKDKGGVKK